MFSQRLGKPFYGLTLAEQGGPGPALEGALGGPGSFVVSEIVKPLFELPDKVDTEVVLVQCPEVVDVAPDTGR